MKVYKGKDGRLRLFRPEMNMDRLARSAARLTLPQFDKVNILSALNAREYSVHDEYLVQIPKRLTN